MSIHQELLSHEEESMQFVKTSRIKSVERIIQFSAFILLFFLLISHIVVVYYTELFSEKFVTIYTSYTSNLAVGLITYLMIARVLAFYYRIKYLESLEIAQNMFLKRYGLLNVKEYGIKDIVPNLEECLPQLRKKIKDSKDVFILTTFLEESLFSFQDIESAGKNGCDNISILMLNPASVITKIRESAINDNSFSIFPMSKRIRNVSEAYYAFQRRLRVKYPNINIEVRYYDSMPPVYFCMCGEYAAVGWYWHSVRTTQTNMIEIDGKNSELWKHLRMEFDHIWKLSSTKTIEQVFPDICRE